MSAPGVYSGVFFPVSAKHDEQEAPTEGKPVERILLEMGDDTSGLVVPEEFFLIPYKHDKFVLYFPAIRAAFLVNEATGDLLRAISARQPVSLDANSLAVLNYFILNGIIQHSQPHVDLHVCEEKGDEFVEKAIQEYAPANVTLCPTSDCNLRCKYCFSHGGEDASYMDFHIARMAIDYLIDRAIEFGKKSVMLGFLGGGEPTLAFDLMKQSIGYARDRGEKAGIELKLDLMTNLMVDEQKLSFIIDNFDTVGVSFDGPQRIQDFQRPAANGKGSYDLVFRNLKVLNESKMLFSIRSTILHENVRNMKEIAEFIFTSFPNLETLHVEPFFLVGRAQDNALKAVVWKDFFECFAEVEHFAEANGQHLLTSYSDFFENISMRFCGALGEAFWVRWDGSVYSCIETIGCGDPIGHTFNVGRFDPVADRFIMDIDVLRKLISRDVDSISNCKGCFAKYNCRGLCPAHVMRRTGDYSDTRNLEECPFIRELIKGKLVELLSRDEHKIVPEDYIPLAEPGKLTDSDLASS